MFRAWIVELVTSVWRLKWFLILGLGGIWLIDLGWIAAFPRLQLVTYKVSVVSVAVAAQQLAWAGVFPYLSIKRIMASGDSYAMIAACLLRSSVFIGTLLSLTLGL